ncbi:MAG: hypothetical protein A2600_07850 [Candidatus Lambdaproteobacteria bacterium RIFOXYD1_FULL_56_27]|uniref:Glycosyl transferase family 1 domain-containing protein n=1 Tax=Candidatus Lambdaproteobacteria bacterium RIFOXYD2_FULL_56_26 TaxID=1817773 RepID=A0A1F6GNQ1_9PROT|nr:MAG: hypothetical protein A2557_06070 [Candidatus Lambdaproteobacteria bacterium RIFOXYD2_FULL_56_26]OGG99871.1 MAG: hypothetical protein A2426_09805 [Candidatus Lambdaproteobacteria bacterium RIFOXYC1_FULL_56_13]OGH09686.1 MAG: hypothetical protein A2600_07850 [Candidatus Lambdaproteobacteria bacterium RIFOXYD1_FULL_56_27]
MKIFMPALGRVNTQNRDGSEVRTTEILKRWLQQGVQVDCLLPKRQVRVFESQGLLGLKYQLLPDPTESESEHLGNVLFLYLTRMVKGMFASFARDYQVIYGPSDFLVDLLPALACRSKNPQAKLVVCLFLVAPKPWRGYEGHYSGKLKRPSLRGLLYYFTQRLAIGLIRGFGGTFLVLNNQDNQALVEAGCRPESVKTVPMGVDVSLYKAPADQAEPLLDGLFIGRLHPQKGLPDLLLVWRAVVDQRPGAKLGIIGGGSEEMKAWLESETRRLGLVENVEYLGFRQGEEKIGYLHRSRCFLMPSHYESWGMTAVEAMAAGLPVVAYDLPVFREIFPQGMIQVPFTDTGAFAQKVLELLEDPALCTQVGALSQAFAGQFDWSRVAADEMAILTAPAP